MWRLDHGSPTLSFHASPQGALNELMLSLQDRGVIHIDDASVVGLDHHAAPVEPPEHPLLMGPRWRGSPSMAAVAEALLADGGPDVDACFGERVGVLMREDGHWHLPGDVRARRLVLSGTLLAHPRSLSMLGWRDVPLRSAVPEGVDPELDAALISIAALNASVRWNLMLELPEVADTLLPRQIWLTSRAQERFGVERVVLHRQVDGRLGLVIHGLDDGAEITPETQPQLLRKHEHRLLTVLPELLGSWPALMSALTRAQSRGVMRWGAAQPLDVGLPAALQWCSRSRIGFCGDWISGDGFGCAEGAFRSALNLAERICS